MGTVHVVGAGLAGLSASVALAESGARVVLHEAAKQAGGRCRSYYDPALGLTIDNGNGTPPTRPFGNQTSVPYNFSWTDGAPDAAVSNGSSVTVLRDGNVAPVAVQTGLTDGVNTEIVSGLQAGDQVVTGVSTSGAGKSTTSTTSGTRSILNTGVRPGG